jgi:hypothetical protein
VRDSATKKSSVGIPIPLANLKEKEAETTGDLTTGKYLPLPSLFLG